MIEDDYKFKFEWLRAALRIHICPMMDGNPIKFQRGLCFHDKKHLVAAGNVH